MKLMLLTTLVVLMGLLTWLVSAPLPEVLDPEYAREVEIAPLERQARPMAFLASEPKDRVVPQAPLDELDELDVFEPVVELHTTLEPVDPDLLEHPNGPWRLLHRNGEIDELGAYENDLEVGRWKWWYDNGERKAIGNFDKGMRVGTWVWYHPNGMVLMEGQYEADRGAGWWKRYHDNGVQHSEGNFIDGEIAGQWSFWHEDGSVDEDRTGLYVAGILQ